MIQPVNQHRRGLERESDRFGRTRTTESRLLQVSRILILIELPAPLRYGATITDLLRDISDTMGQAFCERTIRRDLQMLQTLRVVDVRPGRGRGREKSPMVATINATYQRARSLAAAGMIASEFFEE